MALKIESPKKNETVSGAEVVAAGTCAGVKRLVCYLLSKGKAGKPTITGTAVKGKRGTWRFDFGAVAAGNYRLIVADFLGSPVAAKSVDFKVTKPKAGKAPASGLRGAGKGLMMPGAKAFSVGPTCTFPRSGASVLRNFTATGNTTQASVSAVLIDAGSTSHNPTASAGPDPIGDFSFTFNVAGTLSNPYELELQDATGITTVTNLTLS